MFIYSPEALAKDPENTIYVDQFNKPDDLINNWYNIHYHNGPKSVLQNRIDKLNHIYNNGKLPVSGHGLELAFCFGESIYVLMQWYKEITLDTFDFNPLLIKVMPLMKSLHGRLKDVWIGDAQHIDKPDNYYDFINSVSFFEHLPEDVYWNVVRECYRLIKPGGYLYVYVDKGPNYGEHIRCIPVKQTRHELCSAGFMAQTDYIYRKPE